MVKGAAFGWASLWLGQLLGGARLSGVHSSAEDESALAAEVTAPKFTLALKQL